MEFLTLAEARNGLTALRCRANNLLAREECPHRKSSKGSSQLCWYFRIKLLRNKNRWKEKVMIEAPFISSLCELWWVSLSSSVPTLYPRHLFFNFVYQCSFVSFVASPGFFRSLPEERNGHNNKYTLNMLLRFRYVQYKVKLFQFP